MTATWNFNVIYGVIFPRFQVNLRTDFPMAVCQTLSLSSKKGEGVGNVRLSVTFVQAGMQPLSSHGYTRQNQYYTTGTVDEVKMNVLSGL